MQEKMGKTIVFLIKFSIIMLIIAISIGFIYRIASYIFLRDVPLEFQVFSDKNLAFLDINIVIIGFLIPLSLAFIVSYVRSNIALNLGRIKRIRTAFKIYITGTIIIIVVSIYKIVMYFIKLSTKNITQSLDEIERSLFFGSEILRGLINSLSYPLFVFGLLWFLFVLWKALSKISDRSGSFYFLKRKNEIHYFDNDYK
ncbi:MAG TPA: hypothetical protein PLE45_10595 [Spirochaetota bacterium]|nr:hypothetical protein [Spirochaetota bacterium]HOL57625.1 hypothetical protein [Spirochaetota bacterium]HPP05162.1 hypothetical protein [Spirochaetota bacterium]